MVEKLNALLNQMCTELYENSSNYAVSIEIFSALGMAGEDTNSIVSKALSNPIILGGTDSVNRNEVISAVDDSFHYSEGGSVHPNLEFLGSEPFLSLKQEILGHIQELLQEADQIMSFWIKEGQHPFYPVFWDYAFIIEKGNDAYILIGSASD